MTEFTRGRVDHIGYDSGIEELAEGFTKFFLRLELIDHGVEGGSKLADFICGGYGQGIRVLSIGGFMKGGGESAKSGLQSASDAKKDEESQPAGEGKENQVGPNDMVNIFVCFQD